MGLFWHSPSAPQTDATPVAALRTSYTGIFWASPVESTLLDRSAKPRRLVSDAAEAKSCPVIHKKATPPSNATAPAESLCPVSGVNPNNNMPTLSGSKIPGQKLDLPTSRTVSSIPKGKGGDSGHWEYPSPQQMLNAMVRKSGPDGIEEEAVESMVDVHNFLNEGVWQEVLEWEQPYTLKSNTQPRLLRFTGRPDEMSPRARMLQLVGKIYPSKYAGPPPFDRHDWTVLRGDQDGQWHEVRYVIDFYEAPDEGPMPVFSVDVRPAADSVGNIADRLKRFAGPTWAKAMGK